MIPYCRHEILEDDRRAVDRVLLSDRLTQGPSVPEFEGVLAARTGCERAVAVSSGTSALWLALDALGVGPGDEVLVPSLSFVATANAVLLAGATPIFVDLDAETLSVDPRDLERKLTPRTAGAILVHYAGHPARVDECREVLGPQRFVLEDACHALGAEDHGVPAGSLGDAGCFSFHPAKHITTGEGGAITTNDAAIADRCLRLREHGIERRPGRFVGLGLPELLDAEEQGGWVYEMHSLSANHRLTDLGAALGRSQMERLADNLDRRRQRAEAYHSVFAGDDRVRVLHERPRTRSAWHLYPIRIDLERIRGGRAAFYETLHRAGVLAQVHYIPIHLHPFYRSRFGSKWGDLPVTEKSYLELLSLPLFPGLAEADQGRVIDVVQDAFERLAR